MKERAMNTCFEMANPKCGPAMEHGANAESRSVFRPFFIRGYLIGICGLILMLASEARAELKFTTTTVDKGEVRAGPPLSHRFTFTNRGSANVEITEIQSSCGCLTPQLSRRQYSPGEEGSVVAEINTLSPTPGPHAWQVKLTCRVGDTMQ